MRPTTSREKKRYEYLRSNANSPFDSASQRVVARQSRGKKCWRTSMPRGEEILINGGGSQTDGFTWGDYSSMNIDPVDDYKFWYKVQCCSETSEIGSRTRIGAFNYPTCISFEKTRIKELGR